MWNVGGNKTETNNKAECSGQGKWQIQVNILTSVLKVADGMVVQLWPVSVTQHYACDRERDRTGLME